MLLTYISGGYNSESGVGFGSVKEVSHAMFAPGDNCLPSGDNFHVPYQGAVKLSVS